MRPIGRGGIWWLGKWTRGEVNGWDGEWMGWGGEVIGWDG